MSKRNLLIPLMLALTFVSACASDRSWDKETVTPVSNAIITDEVKADWTIAGGASGAGSATSVRLEIKKADGRPIDEFDITHEKLLHLIIVSKDLSYFNHVHPEYKGNGVFEISNEFPSGGDFRLIADFKPSRGNGMTKAQWVPIEGETAQPIPVMPDTSLDQMIDGKQVKLSIDPLSANKELTLKFSLTDEKTGMPITDLEPYLGSIGHVVILSEDGERYLHVHADEGQGTGPEALFETQFPMSGIYKIWAQFQRQDRVFTVPYVVNVP